MYFVTLNKITTFDDLNERLDKVKRENCEECPAFIIVETKSAFDRLCVLMSNKHYNKKINYFYKYKGIPIVLAWKIRI